MSHSFTAYNKLTQVRNNATTTLSVGISTTVASEASPLYIQFPSSDATLFLIHDSVGNLRSSSTATTHGYISVEDQLMWYDTITTIGSNRRFKVTKRGINKSAQSHSVGRNIQLRVTAQHLLQVLGRIKSIQQTFSTSGTTRQIDLSNSSYGYQYNGSKYNIGRSVWDSMTGYVLSNNAGYWRYDGTWVYPQVYHNVRTGNFSNTGTVQFAGVTGSGDSLVAIDSFGNVFRTSSSGGRATRTWEASYAGRNTFMPVAGYSGVTSRAGQCFSISASKDIKLSSSAVTGYGVLYVDANNKLSITSITSEWNGRGSVIYPNLDRSFTRDGMTANTGKFNTSLSALTLRRTNSYLTGLTAGSQSVTGSLSANSITGLNGIFKTSASANNLYRTNSYLPSLTAGTQSVTSSLSGNTIRRLNLYGTSLTGGTVRITGSLSGTTVRRLNLYGTSLTSGTQSVTGSLSGVSATFTNATITNVLNLNDIYVNDAVLVSTTAGAVSVTGSLSGVTSRFTNAYNVNETIGTGSVTGSISGVSSTFTNSIVNNNANILNNYSTNSYLPSITSGTQSVTGSLSGVTSRFTNSYNVNETIGVGSVTGSLSGVTQTFSTSYLPSLTTGTQSVTGSISGVSSIFTNAYLINLTSGDFSSTGLISTSAVKASTSAGLYLVDDTDHGIFIQDGGNIGVGSNDPKTLLFLKNGQLGITNNTADISANYNSQSAQWSSITLPAIILNGTSTQRPQISFYRGARTFPQFTIRQHTTADTGVTFWTGGGTEPPSPTMSMYSQNVGVGLTAPAVVFEVQSVGNFTGIGLRSSISANRIVSLYEDVNGNGVLRALKADTTSNVYLAASGNSYINGGNVGIGISSPQAILDVRYLAALDGSDPLYLRLTDTQSGNWSVGAKTHGIQFYAGDASTPGAGVVGEIGMYVSGNTSGSSRDMIISTRDSSNNLKNAISIAYNTGLVTFNTQANFTRTGTTSAAATLFSCGTGCLAAKFGSGDCTGFTVDQIGVGVRFNGSGVVWGDLAYYPNGKDGYGNFRFSTTPTTINTTPNAVVGVGQLYSRGRILIANRSAIQFYTISTSAYTTGQFSASDFMWSVSGTSNGRLKLDSSGSLSSYGSMSARSSLNSPTAYITSKRLIQPLSAYARINSTYQLGKLIVGDTLTSSSNGISIVGRGLTGAPFLNIVHNHNNLASITSRGKINFYSSTGFTTRLASYDNVATIQNALENSYPTRRSFFNFYTKVDTGVNLAYRMGWRNNESYLPFIAHQTILRDSTIQSSDYFKSANGYYVATTRKDINWDNAYTSTTAYLNQRVKTTSSPSFVGVSRTSITGINAKFTSLTANSITATTLTAAGCYYSGAMSVRRRPVQDGATLKASFMTQGATATDVVIRAMQSAANVRDAVLNFKGNGYVDNYHRFNKINFYSKNTTATYDNLYTGGILNFNQNVTSGSGFGLLLCSANRNVATSALYILPDGKIGINQLPTTHMLQINGGVQATSGYFGSATDYSKFQRDGTLTFAGSATVYEDMKVDGLRTKTGASRPSLMTLTGGLQSYGFDSGTMNQVYFTAQLPHSYKQGTSISAHVHFATDAAPVSDQVVRWGLQYSWQNISSGIYNSTSTITRDATVYSASGAKRHYLKDLGVISGVGKGISSIIVCRLYRDAGATQDTYASNALLLQCDFHYEIDTIGSRQVLSK